MEFLAMLEAGHENVLSLEQQIAEIDKKEEKAKGKFITPFLCFYFLGLFLVITPFSVIPINAGREKRGFAIFSRKRRMSGPDSHHQ